MPLSLGSFQRTLACVGLLYPISNQVVQLACTRMQHRHVHVHTCAPRHTCIQTHTCMHPQTPVHTDTCVHTDTQMRAHTAVRLFTHCRFYPLLNTNILFQPHSPFDACVWCNIKGFCPFVHLPMDLQFSQHHSSRRDRSCLSSPRVSGVEGSFDGIWPGSFVSFVVCFLAILPSPSA